MRILIVVGARPNFMKAAPIIAAINRHNEASGEPIQIILVHTGQHYDDFMSGSFFTDLKLPRPDVHLGIGSGSHAIQTAEIMKRFEAVLLDEKPDVVLVVGDVNSTLACALVAAKISFDAVGTRPLIVHVEAGLRAFDRSMPEEINRILTDQVSDVLFVSEESGFENLRSEGISPDRIHFVGNTMIDSLLAFKEQADASTILDDLGLRSRPYALMTLHRPANVDNPDAFLNILAGIEELAANQPVVFPVHPRTRGRMKEFSLRPDFEMNVILTDPLGYLDFLCLMKQATLVVTDSGGIQEETTCLGIPCVTVRENTERPATVASGTNVIAGTATEKIRQAIRQQIGRKHVGGIPAKWDGRAATRIVDVLVRTLDRSAAPQSRPVSKACA